MTSVCAPVTTLSAIIAVVMEIIVGIAIVIGFYTRPLALLLALYTLGAAFIGHHYWTMTGMEQYANMINFYKNISIIGGFCYSPPLAPVAIRWTGSNVKQAATDDSGRTFGSRGIRCTCQV